MERKRLLRTRVGRKMKVLAPHWRAASRADDANAIPKGGNGCDSEAESIPVDEKNFQERIGTQGF